MQNFWRTTKVLKLAHTVKNRTIKGQWYLALEMYTVSLLHSIAIIVSMIKQYLYNLVDFQN